MTEEFKQDGQDVQDKEIAEEGFEVWNFKSKFLSSILFILSIPV
jgi:hypothetical protein